MIQIEKKKLKKDADDSTSKPVETNQEKPKDGSQQTDETMASAKNDQAAV